MTPPDAIDPEVRLGILQGLLETGRAPAVADLAIDLGVVEADVAASYDRLAAGRVIVLRPGTREVLMAAPVSAVPTGYPVRLADGRQVYGNCVWDALGVLAMAGVDGDVHARCPDCDVPLHLSVRGGALEATDTVVHFALPPARWWEDIVFT